MEYNGKAEKPGAIEIQSTPTEQLGLIRPGDPEEKSLKRRLDNAERDLRMSKKQIKELKAEVASAAKERQEIQSTISSLYVQIQYWNSWLGKHFSGQLPNVSQDKIAELKGSGLEEASSQSNSKQSDMDEEQESKKELFITPEEQSSLNDELNKDSKQESPLNHKEDILQERGAESNCDSSVADMLKETAQNAFAKTGMSYDAQSGLYYDWNSHMYYDPTTHLFYDNDNGIYYYYDTEKRSYVFYSQVDVSQSGPMSPESSKEKSEGELSSSESEGQIEKVPCIRAIVTASSSLKSGSLYLITCNGATAGRDKIKHLLHIPDVEASKDHAEISYKEIDHQFYMRDDGSINGTFLNEKRLSDSKVQSEWVKIKHKDYLKIGETTFVLHVHYGHETCNECEPGQVQALLLASAEKSEELSSTGLSREAIRKKQLKGLKQKYMIQGDGLREAMDPVNSGRYKDRADKRRKTVGSNPPRIDRQVPAPKASVTKKISDENKGHKMMQQMGWKVGEGLGKQKTGIKEPINVLVREQNKGLGTGVSKSIDEVGGKSVNYKWKKAKQRYDDIVNREQTGEIDHQQLPLDTF